MSKEHDLSNAIDAYLGKQSVDKSFVAFPKGQDPRSPSEGGARESGSWDDIKNAARKITDEFGITKPKVLKPGTGDKTITKAKPKVLKPGTPEHNRAMAEMEAAKARKPKSTNPAGVESPSRPGSRDKLGDRPLVGGLDKQTGPSGPFTKSIDLEEGSRSWSYQG
jgi:hypothetical protein